jgi:hypothetical protein
LKGIDSPDIIDPKEQNQAYAELARFSLPANRGTTASHVVCIFDAIIGSVEMTE